MVEHTGEQGPRNKSPGLLFLLLNVQNREDPMQLLNFCLLKCVCENEMFLNAPNEKLQPMEEDATEGESRRCASVTVLTSSLIGL